jgi:hypothetical protein
MGALGMAAAASEVALKLTPSDSQPPKTRAVLNIRVKLLSTLTSAHSTRAPAPTSSRIFDRIGQNNIGTTVRAYPRGANPNRLAPSRAFTRLCHAVVAETVSSSHTSASSELP